MWPWQKGNLRTTKASQLYPLHILSRTWRVQWHSVCESSLQTAQHKENRLLPSFNKKGHIMQRSENYWIGQKVHLDFFHKMLQKILNEHFDQPSPISGSNLTHCLFSWIKFFFFFLFKQPYPWMCYIYPTRQSWIVTAETIWLTEPKIFTPWSLSECLWPLAYRTIESAEETAPRLSFQEWCSKPHSTIELLRELLPQCHQKVA